MKENLFFFVLFFIFGGGLLVFIGAAIESILRTIRDILRVGVLSFILILFLYFLWHYSASSGNEVSREPESWEYPEDTDGLMEDAARLPETGNGQEFIVPEEDRSDNFEEFLDGRDENVIRVRNPKKAYAGSGRRSIKIKEPSRTLTTDTMVIEGVRFLMIPVKNWRAASPPPGRKITYRGEAYFMVRKGEYKPRAPFLQN